MRTYLLGAAALLTAGAALAQVAQPVAQPVAPRAATPRNPYLTGVQGLFDGYVSAGRMPGIVGAFGVGDGPTQFVVAGRQGLEPGAPPAGPDTLWRIYSMTKPITGMAAMMLIEDGKLRLDQPISDILPAFGSMRVLTDPQNSLASRPATRPITVRNLLTHTAGFGYSLTATGPLLREYERLGLVPFAANRQVEAKVAPTRPRSLQEFAARVATVPLIADPGTRWSYSMSLDVMGAVIEKASGMPFERFVQTRIFAPLGMTESFWQVPASSRSALVTNYTFVGDTLVPLDPAATSTFLDPPSFPYGGAGLVTSARDYDRFLHMLVNEGTLDGVRVMKPETVRLGMSDLLPPGVTFTDVGGSTGGVAGPKMGYGAGGSVYLEDRPGGASKGTYGWGGAAGTVAWVDPVRKVRGTVMVNYFPADKWPLRQEMTAALFRDAARLHPAGASN